MESQLQENLKMVAAFLGHTIIDRNGEYAVKTSGGSSYLRLYKYNTDWTVQIPAWSKAIKQYEELIEELSINSQSTLKRDLLSIAAIEKESYYNYAVRHDQPEEGFKVLVEAVKWINEHK